MFKKILLVAALGCLVCLPKSAAWATELIDRELPNGLRVVVMENPASPTVSVNIFIAAGSLDETPQTSGLAHFYEHMFFRGTPSLSGLAFKKSIEDLGGVTNATTAKDMTHFFIALPSEHADRGVELLADALMRAELEPEGIETERDVVLEEYRLGEANPGRLAYDSLYEMAYGDHPYSRSTIGTKESIRSLGRPELSKWRNDNYHPSRCTVVVVGDVDAEKTFAKARTVFASFSDKGAQPRKLTEPPSAPEEPVFKEGTAPVGSTILFLGYPSPSGKETSDVYAVDVLSFLLGQGSESRLKKVLVEEKELAQSVDVTFQTPLQHGLIVISAVAADKKYEELKTALIAEIAKVRNGDFTDSELERAKALLSQSFLVNNETNSGKADSVGFYAVLGVPDFWKTYDKSIGEVTRADVVAAAQKYMGGGYWGYTLKPGRGKRS